MGIKSGSAALALWAVCMGLPGYGQENPSPQTEKNAQQDIDQIKKQLEEQRKQNEALMKRVSSLEEEIKKQEKEKKQKSGGEPLGITMTRPDGRKVPHRETPWADGETGMFHYLGESALQEVDDFPIGIFYGSKSSFAEFHGFSEVVYFDFERQGPRQGRGSFDAHHFYLSARAELRNNLFTFIEVEYEHGVESEIVVDRAYLDWKLANEFSLQFGLRFAPFGIDKQLTALAPLKNSVSNPVIIDQFEHGDWPMVGVYATGMIDLPLQIRKGGKLDYTVGVVNGEAGLKKDDGGGRRDNNADKTGIVNVGVSPFVADEEWGSLRVGFSHIFQNRFNADQTADSEQKTELTGLDVLWDWKGAHLRGEYISRDADYDTTNSVRGNGNGFYVELAYDVAPQLTKVELPFSEKDNFNLIRPFVRYNRSDTPLSSAGFSTGRAGEEIKRWDWGLLVSPYPHFKFRVEIQNARETYGLGGRDLNNNGFLSSVTVDF